MTKFFLNRPIFATVFALIITIAGLIAIPTLPVAQYPQINPPVVTISAFYLGADPKTVESAVTIPLEQAVNGVQGLNYLSSVSAQGSSSITCTFHLGTNLDIAAADVQNAIQSAFGRLPGTVTQSGVTVSKNAGSFVMGMSLISNTKKYDTLFLSNYAALNIVNDLKRIPGVSNVNIFGERLYAMRIWLDPHELAARGLTVTDVLAAIQSQNAAVPGGSIGAPPQPANQPYTYVVSVQGRLTTPQQFRDIILRSDPNGGITRLSDVARVDLGAEDYSSFLRFDGHQNVVGMGVQQYPSANALTVSSAVIAEMNKLEKKFPAGVHYQVAFSSTAFVQESIKDVLVTLLISILLVIAVIYLFLQNGRATLIPAITIPVALIGTFAIMKIFGFSINTITLFGITLATGLVVDDAIVVIENIERIVKLRGTGVLAGAAEAMEEIQGAVVASSLVLLAVFIPVAFFPGTTGQIYKQFALTIVGSISISLFASLTLAPPLAVKFLHVGDRPPRFGLFTWFNRRLERFRNSYAATLPRLIKVRRRVLVGFAATLALVVVLFKVIPSGFIPDEDQGFLMCIIQAPEGTSLAGEHAVAVQVEKYFLSQPQVEHVFNIGGFSFGGSTPNRGMMFIRLKPWNDRTGPFNTASFLSLKYFFHFMSYARAQVLVVNPPAISGVGTTAGFQFELENNGTLTLRQLDAVAKKIIAAAAKDPRLVQVRTQFAINSPQLDATVDRQKAISLGVPLSDLYATLGVMLGGAYVNDFNYLDQSYRVYVEGDEPYRDRIASLQSLYTRSASGGMIPLPELVSVKRALSAPVIDHYNLYRNIEITGQAASGHSSGEAITAMEQIFKRVAPPGVSYEWSGISLEEIHAGTQTILLFTLGIIFVFLVLAALYENWIDPLIVLLAVPAALFGALALIGLRNLVPDFIFGILGAVGVPIPNPFGNMAQNVYVQVGYVMLVGLASKNAILIVEFANQQLRAGADITTAALRGAQTRLRPILMTSIAFILGATPLVFATGAGSAARQSIGTVVFGGMVVSTFLNLLVTPVLYVVIKSAEERFFGRPFVETHGTTAGLELGENSTPPQG